jgi:phosphoribosyl-dephospho-CoA transferase
MRPADFNRHDWVYLPDDWRKALAGPLAPAHEAALARWTVKGRPLVVARRRDDDAPGLLRLGLAMPDKTRIGVLLPAEAVTLHRHAPYFLDIADSAEALWPEALRALTPLIAQAAPNMRVFGSFAWQFFAANPALRFVAPSSDLDLLLAPGRPGSLAALIGALQDFERRFPAPRLDGEVALPGGDFVEFVSWREFSARPKKLLVKGAATVSLRPIEDVEFQLAARAA